MIDTILNNRYRLDAVIGQGGMAVVYRGYDLLLRRQVAVKVLRPQHAADQIFVQRFYEEARAAAKLSHPNIVNTYDVGEVDGSHYIVEEFVAGETLATLIAREGKLPESSAVRYARQICLALGAAHRADLLHRDIKPSNVLITPDDTVRVTDFGIARAANAATLSGVEAIMGSIPYASPEQLSGSALTPASDLYSLGVVLFEMVTGRQPYVAETALGVAMAHVNSPIPDPAAAGAAIHPQLADVITTLLQKKPADRYQSAGETLAALRRCGRQAGEELDEAPGDDASTALFRRKAASLNRAPQHEVMETAPAWSMRRVVFIATAAVALIILVSVLLASRGGGARGLALPDLAGKSQVDAVSTLHEMGIDSVAFVLHQDPSVAAGLVDGSSPAPTTPVKPGDRVMLYLSSGPPHVLVPNLVGKSVKEAMASLSALGLSARVGASIHSGSVRSGLVVSTNPESGSPIDRGGTVALNPSAGPLLAEVPNVVASSVDQAQAALRRLGFKLVVNLVPSVDIPAQTIIDQDPPGGSNAPPGATVTADVSAGPNSILVPNVMGMSRDDARFALEQAGLVLGNVAFAAVSDTSPGTVIGQHPNANAQAPGGTSVDIVVAQAPASPSPGASASPLPTLGPSAAVSVPDVTGMSLSDAQNALAKANLAVNRVTMLPGSSPGAKVTRTDPPAGTSVPQGSAVNLFLGGR